MSGFQNNMCGILFLTCIIILLLKKSYTLKKLKKLFYGYVGRGSMKRKICAAIFIILGIAFIVFIKVKHNATNVQYDKQLLGEIYLYYDDKIGKVTEENDIYVKLTDEIIYIVNNPDICVDSIDGLLYFQGNGMPIDARTDETGYILEVNFKEPITTLYADSNISNICRIVISVDSHCIYIYKKDSEEKNLSVSGYRCEDNVLDNISSILMDYFAHF